MTSKPFIKTQLYTFLFLLFFILLTLLAVAGVASLKVRTFTRNAQVDLSEIIKTVRTGWRQTPTQVNGYKNLLILGLDTLETRGDAPALTDTMMLVSLGLGEDFGEKDSAKDARVGQIKMLSLPRDLWNEDYQTRINALYFYGQEKYPQNPEQFSQEIIEQMTGIDLQHTLVLSFGQVGEVIDMLGGLEIDVPIGFVDEEFPRTDVDVTTVHDPKLLYKTVEFKKGKQTMDGAQILEYIRSRKSGDDEGTDVARGTRQQLVIEALIAKLKQKDTIYDVALLGNLYRYYLDNFADSLPPEELVAIAKAFYPARNKIEFETNTPSIYPDDEDGVIWHPPVRQYQGEWVYTVRDEDEFSREIQSKLN